MFLIFSRDTGIVKRAIVCFISSRFIPQRGGCPRASHTGIYHDLKVMTAERMDALFSIHLFIYVDVILTVERLL